MINQINSNKKIVLADLSYKIMGALFKVHNELGPSMLEKHYQRALTKEFADQNITFKREVVVDLYYKDEIIGKYRLDFLIENKVILELKAEKYSDPTFFKQVFSYLKHTHLPLAILANFRRVKLEYKRIINPEFKNHSFD